MTCGRVGSGREFTVEVARGTLPQNNNRMQLTAPRGDRAVHGGVDAAAACAPFGHAPAPQLIRVLGASSSRRGGDEDRRQRRH